MSRSLRKHQRDKHQQHQKSSDDNQTPLRRIRFVVPRRRLVVARTRARRRHQNRVGAVRGPKLARHVENGERCVRGAVADANGRHDTARSGRRRPSAIHVEFLSRHGRDLSTNLAERNQRGRCEIAVEQVGEDNLVCDGSVAHNSVAWRKQRFEPWCRQSRLDSVARVDGLNPLVDRHGSVEANQRVQYGQVWPDCWCGGGRRAGCRRR